MIKRIFLGLLVLFILGLFFAICLADEGMWMLDSIDKLPWSKMREMGLKLSPKDVYNPKGDGIARAIVNVAGASGSFVSPEGLIVTNHHVAFSAIQRQSKPGQNYLKEGFHAKTKAEEIPAIGYNVYVTLSMDEITDKVLVAVDDRMDDLERYKAIEKRTKQIIDEAEAAKDVKCEVVSVYGGMQYYLFTYFKIKDVRIVYVPPLSIGEYGGEIDNWMWPRHTGDFSFLRAYVAGDGKSADYSPDNVPYRPEIYLKVSSAGIKEGDFAMMIGFPGWTARYSSSFSVEDMQNYYYFVDIGIREDLIKIMEQSSQEDSSVALRLSSKIKGIYNYLKKNQGVLEGFEKSKVLEHKREEERNLAQYLKENPQLDQKYGDVLPSLEKLYEDHKTYRDKDFILSWMISYCDFLGLASTINKWSIEKQKQDMEREPEYMDREIPQTRKNLENAQINLVPSCDKKILAYFLKKAHELPPGQKIEVVEKLFENKKGSPQDQVISDFVSYLYANTKIGTLQERMKMFDMTQEELEKLVDPFIDFARELEKEREVLKEKDKRFNGALSKLEPKLIQAYAEWKKGLTYPDANGTIRFNYGTVQGYIPGDAVFYKWITILTGVMQKNTGKEPFEVPIQLEEIYQKKDFGKYFDKSIGDVPVNFLTTNDGTNGNSGSPIMNGKGELIGLTFDGNYESMAADYEFEEEINRSINVDIRYVLFILDKVYHIENVLGELVIH
ncbi:MAG TPA: S46 family peptidase [candidate division Zixibacteria bacterium]